MNIDFTNKNTSYGECLSKYIIKILMNLLLLKYYLKFYTQDVS